MTDRDVLLSVKAAIDAWLSQPPVPPPVPPSPPRLAGINLAGVDSTSTEFPFTDALKASRPFYSQIEGLPYDAGKAAAMPVSPRGWPLSLAPKQFAETLIFEGMPGHYPTGGRMLIWSGTGTVQVAADGQVQGTLAKSGPVTITKADAGSVAVRILKTDPADPVHNLSMVGIDGYTPHLLPRFLNRWMGFGPVRFMDWLRVSTSKLSRWADRPRLDDATYAGPNGAPLEACTAAAWLLGADPWLCVPMAADDDYVKQMAELVENLIPVGRKVWVEYGNECWNDAYDEPGPLGRWTKRYCRERGRALNLATDDYTAALRFYALRCGEIFSLFTQALGPDRLTRVLAWHADNPGRGEELLDYQGAGKAADAVAIAPYWGHGDQVGTDTAVATMTADAILDKCEWLIARNRPNIEAWAALAKARGLRLVAYEGGQHLTAAPSQNPDLVSEKFIAANRHPRMHDLYRKDWEQWRAAGGDAFCFFSSVSRYGRAGSWGLLEYDAQETGPKYAAAREAAG